MLTLQSWNAGTGDGRKTSLGPLEDRKEQHNEEVWSFPTVNDRYIAKFLILFFKEKIQITTVTHRLWDFLGSQSYNPETLNKLLGLDLFLKQG